MAEKIKYLTVQDVLWANLQITRRVNHFNHARLEEATYTQYAYGANTDLPAQAARFLSGFTRLAPLDKGNAATAFVCALAVLRLNDQELHLADAEGPAWLAGVLEKRVSGAEAMSAAARPSEHHHHDVGPRDAIRAVIDAYPATLLELTTKA